MSSDWGEDFEKNMDTFPLPGGDGEGILQEYAETPKDFVEDLYDGGKTVFDSTVDSAEDLYHDVVSDAESVGSDIAGGHPIEALEDLGGGVVHIVEDVGEGVFGDVLGATSGILTAGGTLLAATSDLAMD
ncbi:MAG: hypothetical protein JO246_17520, partial [Frankiaceae bacterium]|nr:hypothetical protein [Frankiaceae bacterium]